MSHHKSEFILKLASEENVGLGDEAGGGLTERINWRELLYHSLKDSF